MSILAIILNWNQAELTRNCIKSLREQINTPPDIIVIDNASEGNSVKKLTALFPDIEFIINDSNLGVAAGRNIGIDYAIKKKYEYILIFDNDAYAAPNMLQKLIEAAIRNPVVGIFGPKILQADEPDRIYRAGCTSWKLTYLHATYEIIKRIYKFFHQNMPFRLDKTRGYGVKDCGQYDKEEEIDFQIGCAQLIKTEMVKQIGPLDEEYTPYGSEDIDFCARALKKGWKIRYVPKAVCWHNVELQYADDYNRTYQNSKNILLLARKNLTRMYFWFLFIPDFILLYIPLAIFQYVLQNKPMKVRGFLDAIEWNIKDIFKRGIFLR